ncbi:MAG: VPLPA-CTERM sorting domain-containing protein [Steroidobacteraceae bacterium]
MPGNRRGSPPLGAVSALAILAGIITAPGTSRADTVVTLGTGAGSDLATGTPGSATTSAFCLLPNTSCPNTATTTLNLGASDPVSGTFSYDSTNNTLSFKLTLAANASFASSGSSVNLLAGTSFSASDIAMTATTKGKTVSLAETGYEYGSTTPATVAVNLMTPAGVSVIADQPLLSGLTCSITSGTSGECGFLLNGSTGANSLQIGSGGYQYNAAFDFNANLTAVPLPPSVWLMMGGLGCLLTMRRRDWA